ncbi:MAG TPA: TlyA family RNA methyltransferase [Dehalococcoidia bacterium]|nr:TlyA family RNA methyltransferase [Dehalococcoidia bacterium]
MSKQRIDTLLVDRGLAESPEKARALVMAGQVLAAARPVSKPGMLVEETAALEVARGPRYVSRGGEKLEHALHSFGLDVSGLLCADIGSSTGGFTDCLLQHGASRVYAVDVGKGQLDYGLRNDPRVVVMEGVNARHLEGLPEPVDFVSVDVSFISLRLVLPVVQGLLAQPGPGGRLKPAPQEDVEGRLKPAPRGDVPTTGVRIHPDRGGGGATGSIVVLFKPQFEAPKGKVPRGGVIRDVALQALLIGGFVAWCAGNGFRVINLVASPILGAEGNREFLLWLRPAGDGAAEAGKSGICGAVASEARETIH